MTVVVVGGLGAPGDFDFVGEIGEDFRVTAKLQIERLFDGDGTAAVTALVPEEQRVDGWVFTRESTAAKRFDCRRAGIYTQLKPP